MRAHYVNGVTSPTWDLWVASKAYDEAPKEVFSDGTVAPVAKSFESLWVGRSIQDCANWLREAPDYVAVHPDYFTAIDAHSKDEDTVLVCRWFDCGGAIDVEYFPQSTDDVTMCMYTNDGLSFEERALCYQDRMKREGKPDRSKLIKTCA
jgi:hypothetical protein